MDAKAITTFSNIIETQGIAVGLVIILCVLIGYMVYSARDYIRAEREHTTQASEKWGQALQDIEKRSIDANTELSERHREERDLWRQDAKETKGEIVQALNRLEDVIARR